MVRHGVEQGPALRRSRLWVEPVRVGSRLSLFVATVLTVALALLALRTLDFGEVSTAFTEAELIWLLPSFGALAAAFVIRALRWQLLFSADQRPPFREISAALVAGLFFNSVLPFRAGEVARVLVLHRRTGTPRLQVLGTIVAERIYDVLALLALLALALPWLPDVPWLRGVAIAGGAAAVVVALASAALVFWGERFIRIIVWPLRFLSAVTEARREQAGRSLLAGVAALHQPFPAAAAALLTLLSWLVLWLSYWLLLQGFELDVGAAAALLALVATGFSLAVPSGPSAVGVFEAAVIVALIPFGAPAEEALIYALVLHALNVVPYVAVGVVLLPRLVRSSSRGGGSA